MLLRNEKFSKWDRMASWVSQYLISFQRYSGFWSKTIISYRLNYVRYLRRYVGALFHGRCTICNTTYYPSFKLVNKKRIYYDITEKTNRYFEYSISKPVTIWFYKQHLGFLVQHSIQGRIQGKIWPLQTNYCDGIIRGVRACPPSSPRKIFKSRTLETPFAAICATFSI